MPAGGSSYLPAMSRGRRSFAYHKLKKLPPASPTTAAFEQQDQQSPLPSAAAIQESYQSYYRALGAAVARGRRRQWHQERRRVRPRRLRISALARALRRRAAAVGGRVRAAAAKVARRLIREGRPYIGDLFAGNYMFMQVAPSPTMVVDAKAAPFAEYYYAKVGKGVIRPVAPPAAAAGALQAVHHHHPAAAAVMYKV